MIKNMIMRLWVLCVALLAMPLQADESSVLDLARRITGHYEPDSEIKKIQVKVWDSMTDEARKYIRFMNAKPSRVFRQREEGDERCPKEIESLEDLEDTVYDMHFNLESARTIQLSSKVDPEEWELWIKKVNTVMSFCVASYGEGTTRDFYVFYGSDARVLAAFRNPMLESELNEQEKELLEVCAQWIADNIEENMPNLLKIKKVHDALVDNCKYTYGYYDTYNMIVKGRGVCAAYTSSTRMLLHMLKIDCRCVRGTEAMNHIWNIIDVNGDWYFTDVTWDDPIAPDGRDVKRFTYFLLTKAEMEMSHEWEEPEIYPETPAINKLGLFKRHDHREVKGDVNEEEENNLVYPRERESVLDTILEMRRKEIEKQIDKMQKPAEPLLNAASSAAAPVVKNTKSVSTFIPRKKRASKSKAEYKPINTLDDLYENLEICCRELDGPNVTFDVVNSCGCFAQQMLMADYHLYVKYWNFRYDSKERKLKLDIEHWPHIKLLSTHKS